MRPCRDYSAVVHSETMPRFALKFARQIPALTPCAVLRAVIVLTLLTALLATSGCRSTAPTRLEDSASGPHISVRLLADHQTIAPGSTITLGVELRPEPEWHVYWKNPGDSGLPPKFTWSTSAGVSVGAPLWPAPARIPVGPLMNFGYGQATILFPTTISTGVAAGDSPVRIEAALEWLVCKEECIPGSAVLRIALPTTHPSGEPSSAAPLFEQAQTQIPTPLQNTSLAVEEQSSQLVLALIPADGRQLPTDLTFFPEEPGVVLNSAPQTVTRDGAVVRITLTRDPRRGAPVERIHGVLVAPSGWPQAGEPHAVSIDTAADSAVHGVVPTPTATRPLQNSSDYNHPLTAEPATPVPLLMALLFGFLGGLLLNLMPCVFPVLSIKVLSCTELAGRAPREARLHTLTFSAGVVVSFWVLAGILALLRAGGMQLGWGFQLQSPLFVVALIGVFMAVGLLFLSPLTIGASVQRVAGRLRLPASLLGSFLDGVLATAVATPCTAPLMGTAVAAAVTLSTPYTLAIFTSMGLGMSAPYLVLAWRTELLRYLPRPGVWMERLKQLLAFPLFATAVWLLRVFGRQIGIAPAHLTLLLNIVWGVLLLALGVWVLHQAALVKTRWRSRLCRLIGGAILVSAAWLAAPAPQEMERAQHLTLAAAGAPGQADAAAEVDRYGLAWLPFSEERLSALRATQKPVYIDFTAEWCITCQVNKRTVFSSARVQTLVASRNITLLRADWTSADPTITTALKKFGRAGVPLNVFYSGAPHEQAVIFPALLSASIVAEAFERIPERVRPAQQRE